jgi:hypothetical protein
MINKKSPVVTKEKAITNQPMIQVNESNQHILSILDSLAINLYIDATDYYFLMLEQCA